MKCAHQRCWMQVCVKSEAHCQIFTKLTKSAQRGGSFLALICASSSPPPSWLRPGNQFQCTILEGDSTPKRHRGERGGFFGRHMKAGIHKPFVHTSHLAHYFFNKLFCSQVFLCFWNTGGLISWLCKNITSIWGHELRRSKWFTVQLCHSFLVSLPHLPHLHSWWDGLRIHL